MTITDVFLVNIQFIELCITNLFSVSKKEEQIKVINSPLKTEYGKTLLIVIY